MKSKSGGTQAEAKKLADKFQAEVRGGDAPKDRHRRPEQIIKDKDVDGTKPKKRTDKPSNFVSNKDFNPGSDLRLLSLPEEQSNFYTEIFQRELKDNDDPNAMMAAGGRQGNPAAFSRSADMRCKAASDRRRRRAPRSSRMISTRRERN